MVYNRRSYFARSFVPYLVLGVLILYVLWPSRVKKEKKPKEKKVEINEINPEKTWKFPSKDLDLNPEKYNKLIPWGYADEEEAKEAEKRFRMDQKKLEEQEKLKKSTKTSTIAPKKLGKASTATKSVKVQTTEKPLKNMSKSTKFLKKLEKIELKNISKPAKMSNKTRPRSNLTAPPPVMKEVIMNDKKPLVEWSEQLKIYLINKKPILWTFLAFSGQKRRKIPGLLRLALGSVLCHNLKRIHLEIVTEKTVKLWLTEIHPAFYLLTAEHKKDYFRARILDEYGGMYVDPATIGLARGLITLYRKLRWYHLIYTSSYSEIGQKLSRLVAGPMRARSKFTTQWVNKLQVELDKNYGQLEKYSSNKNANSSGKYPMITSEILGGKIDPKIGEFPYFLVNVANTFSQLLDKTKFLYKNDTVLSLRHSKLLMFNFSAAPTRVRKLTSMALLKKGLLISELLKFSFGKCMEEEKLRNISKKPAEVFKEQKGIKISAGAKTLFEKSRNGTKGDKEGKEKHENHNQEILEWTKKFLVSYKLAGKPLGVLVPSGANRLLLDKKEVPKL